VQTHHNEKPDDFCLNIHTEEPPFPLYPKNVRTEQTPSPLTADVFYGRLGILVDSSLNFRNHLEIVEQKLSRDVRIINKLKFFLPRKALQNCTIF